MVDLSIGSVVNLEPKHVARSDAGHYSRPSINAEEHLTMAKRKKRSKPARKRKAAAKRKTAKPSPKKRTPRADRAKILAAMRSSGMTAKQAAKKYGISIWTIYNWSKRRGAKKQRAATRRGRKAGASTSRIPASLQGGFRQMIAGIVRAEIVRLLGR
jgi:DNA invertase Pin-like site-specific DNA recombinase